MREINLRSGSKSRSASGSTKSSSSSSSSSKNHSDKAKPVLFTLAVLALAVLLLGGTIIYGVFYSEKIRKANTVELSESKYYAVFLSNGQVYFGNLMGYNTENPILKDIYYLQLAQSPQATTEGQQATEGEVTEGEATGAEGQVLEQPGQTTSDQGLTLIKLGEELHGPEDSMLLNKEQILFVEQLKDDGKVVKAIGDYKDNKEDEEE